MAQCNISMSPEIPCLGEDLTQETLEIGLETLLTQHSLHFF